MDEDMGADDPIMEESANALLIYKPLREQWDYSEHFNLRLLNLELKDRLAAGWTPIRETAFGTRVLVLWYRYDMSGAPDPAAL